MIDVHLHVWLRTSNLHICKMLDTTKFYAAQLYTYRHVIFMIDPGSLVVGWLGVSVTQSLHSGFLAFQTSARTWGEAKLIWVIDSWCGFLKCQNKYCQSFYHTHTVSAYLVRRRKTLCPSSPVARGDCWQCTRAGHLSWVIITRDYWTCPPHKIRWGRC